MCVCFYLFGFSFFEFFVHSRCIITGIQKKWFAWEFDGYPVVDLCDFWFEHQTFGKFTEILLVSCNCKHHHRLDS